MLAPPCRKRFGKEPRPGLRVKFAGDDCARAARLAIGLGRISRYRRSPGAAGDLTISRAATMSDGSRSLRLPETARDKMLSRTSIDNCTNAQTLALWRKRVRRQIQWHLLYWCIPCHMWLKINLYCSSSSSRNTLAFSPTNSLILSAFLSKSQNFSISFSAFKSLMSRQ